MTADLLSIKRRWLPLFAVGIALFGAGVALVLLWLYRNSPLVEVVVGLLTTPARGVPPRGTLISLAALLASIGGAGILWYAVRRINASEIGEIDSFWSKVAVAALAGRWWLGEPRVVVAGLGAGEAVLPVLRGLKAFTGRVVLLVPPDAPRPVIEAAMIALAEDEAGVQALLASLAKTGAALEAAPLSMSLRLRGRLEPAVPSPRLAEAIARAEAILLGPDSSAAGLPAQVLDWLRASPARKIGLTPILEEGEGALADLSMLAGQAGPLDAALVNSNTVPPLTDGQRYRNVPQAGGPVRAVFARDVVDWAQPARHDPAKLAVFLREVILRD